MNKEQLKKSSGALIIGTLLMPGIGTAAAALVPLSYLISASLKSGGKWAKAARNSAAEKERQRREERRIALLPPPPPPPRPRTIIDDYNDLMALKRADLAMVERLAQPEDEKEAIREMIEADYADRMRTPSR